MKQEPTNYFLYFKNRSFINKSGFQNYRKVDTSTKINGQLYFAYIRDGKVLQKSQ